MPPREENMERRTRIRRIVPGPAVSLLIVWALASAPVPVAAFPILYQWNNPTEKCATRRKDAVQHRELNG